MNGKRFRVFSLGVLVLGLVVAACSVDVGVGPGGFTGGFTIFGKEFRITLGDIGAITFRAGFAITVPTAVRLFDETPTEVPPSGTARLLSSDVGIARRLTPNKGMARSQALPLNGTATIRLKIATGSSAELCDSAVLLAEYDLAWTLGTVTILQEDYSISQAALAVIATNDVTICIEIEADFDGEMTIDGIIIIFGGGDGGSGGPDDTPPPPTPGTTLQVPIDNSFGVAVVSPVNRTIGLIDYSVAGVLEAATPDAPPTFDTNSVSLDLDELGLRTVQTLYMGTHSSFVPDLPDGVRLATLFVDYAEGGSPTVLPIVMGTNTSEWSYDRPEHVSILGGVQHDLAPTLYSFTSTADSAFPYTGYSYSVRLDLDATRTPSCLTLEMTDPSTYSFLRSSILPEPTWAAQAITAITLVGPAGVPSVVGSCFGVIPDCTFDFDCVPGEICLNRRCVPEGGAECSSNSDCLTDETCINGVCVPSEPVPCVLNADCATDEVCTNGECVETTEACAADGECNENCPVDNLDPDCEENCDADGFCNENCSDLTPDSDCDTQIADAPRCTTSSAFGGGDEGWTILGDAQGGRGDPNYLPTGGNPGGHIGADDDAQGGVWFFQAPAKFHGNYSGALGMTMTWDQKQSSLSSQFDANDVVLIGGGLTLVVDAGGNPGLDWTAYSVLLSDAGGWRLGSLSGTPATQADILTVLADLQDIQIRGEFVDGIDSGSLDNFVLNSTCAGGAACNNGFCPHVEPTSCTSIADCAVGEACVNGECATSTENCAADGECNVNCPVDNQDPDCEENCNADGFCNENCSDLTPDPDCDTQTTGIAQCTTSSVFAGGDEGWTILGDAQGGRGDPDYFPTGGNPGGYIAANDDVQGGTWFFQVPAKFHGNFSGALGMTMTWDQKQSNLSSQFDGNDVVLIGGGLTLVVDAGANPGLDWTAYSVALSEAADWRIGSLSGTPATQADILTVLSDLQDIHIRGEFVSGADTGSLDNFVLNSACAE